MRRAMPVDFGDPSWPERDHEEHELVIRCNGPDDATWPHGGDRQIARTAGDGICNGPILGMTGWAASSSRKMRTSDCCTSFTHSR